MDEIIQALNDADKSLTFGLSGPLTATVLEEGAGYRRWPLTGSEEFFFKSARAGKRSDIVLSFEPVDARPWQHMEMSDKDALSHVVGLDAWVTNILGQSLAKAKKASLKATASKSAIAPAAADSAAYTDNDMYGAF